MLNFLPGYVTDAINNLNYNNLYEIRLRANKPVIVSYDGTYKYLSSFGLTENEKSALIITFEEIEGIIMKATEFSLYSVTNQLNSGYLTVENGIRIGIAGEYVIEKGKILTIKNITSINVRIAHEIIGCGDLIYEFCEKNFLNNLLIISPPGLGKTTLLRDISRQISLNYKNNILIIDERNEIASVNKNYSFDVGKTADVIKYSDKLTAFEVAVRSMRPDIIITDELAGENDVLAASRAIYSGVKVIASCHLNSIDSILNKNEFKSIYENKLFDYYTILSTKKIGQTQFIFDKDFNMIYGLN